MEIPAKDGQMHITETAISMVLAAGLLCAQTTVKYRISSAEIGRPVRYNSSPDHFVFGDTWSAAWSTDAAGNDAVYSTVDDTGGFNNGLSLTGCKPECGRNLAIASFDNTAPPNLTGRIVNDMRAFGLVSQSSPGGPPEEAWKANGLTAIDGVLYLSVSRHRYGQRFFDFRQRAYDANIVRSVDHGRTWSPLPPGTNTPYAQPMFPGPKFGAPVFVQYGKDGAAPDGVDPADEAGAYVYAASTDGFWDNGDSLYMGRVRRTEIMDPAKWEFIAGYDAAGKPQWRSGAGGLEAATPILSEAGRASMAGIQYVPAAGRYILPEWHYPDLGSSCDPNPQRPVTWGRTPFSDPGKTCVKHSVWQFYEAPHPWGPWTLFHEQDFKTEGFYNPAIFSRFMTTADAEGTVSLWIITTGTFPTGSYAWDKTYYTAFLLPMKVKLEKLSPQPSGR